jgi:hypothetical protein
MCATGIRRQTEKSGIRSKTAGKQERRRSYKFVTPSFAATGSFFRQPNTSSPRPPPRGTALSQRQTHRSFNRVGSIDQPTRTERKWIRAWGSSSGESVLWAAARTAPSSGWPPTRPRASCWPSSWRPPAARGLLGSTVGSC